MSELTVGSLFSGIGGFDLAARWVGWKTIWYSEIEPYACRVMEKNFPDAVNHGDVTQIKGAGVERPDVLTGGFPCQDISTAGRGEGIEGSRSSLWSEFARLIGELRPRWVVAENSPALRRRGLDVVLSDLCAVGYDAEWHCIPASAVGALHRRDRIYIVAYPHSSGGREGPRLPLRLSEGEAGRLIPGPSGSGGCLPGADDPEQRAANGRPDGSEAWASEPDVGRVADGIPNRVDRIRCLGNSVVPQVVYVIFRAIQIAEEMP